MTTYHHGDLPNALLDAAEQLLNEHGVDGVSVRKAATVAGVSAGAPYRHFRDRDALMSALAARGHLELAGQMQARIDAAGDNSLDQLRAQGVAFVLYARERPEMFRVMHHAPWIAPGASPQMDAVLSELSDWTDRLGAEAQGAGQLAATPLPPQILACRALVYGLARLYVDGHTDQLGLADADPEEVVTAVVAVIGDGLMPR